MLLNCAVYEIPTHRSLLLSLLGKDGLGPLWCRAWCIGPQASLVLTQVLIVLDLLHKFAVKLDCSVWESEHVFIVL